MGACLELRQNHAPQLVAGGAGTDEDVCNPYGSTLSGFGHSRIASKHRSPAGSARAAPLRRECSYACRASTGTADRRRRPSAAPALPRRWRSGRRLRRGARRILPQLDVRAARGGRVRPRLCVRSRRFRVERRGAAAANHPRASWRNCERCSPPAAMPPPYILVGHSFGGLTARLFLHRHPEEVAGLVLLDPAYPEDWTPPSAAHRSPRSPGRTAVPLRAPRRALRYHRAGRGARPCRRARRRARGRLRRQPWRTPARGRGSHGTRGEAAAGRARDRAAILDAAEVLRGARQPDRVDQRERCRGSRWIRSSGTCRWSSCRARRTRMRASSARQARLAARSTRGPPRHRRAQRPLDSARSAGRGGPGDS